MDSSLRDINSMFPQLVAKLKMNGAAVPAREAIELAGKLKPDIIRADLNIKILNGTRTLEALKSAGIKSGFVMLTVSGNEAEMIAAVEAGADRYLLKRMEPEDFLENLKKAFNGMMVLGDNLAENALMEGLGPAKQPELTQRDREVLHCLGAGLNNKSIARQMGISGGTVKVHIKHLLCKLKLHSRLEAAAWVHEHSGSYVGSHPAPRVRLAR